MPDIAVFDTNILFSGLEERQHYRSRLAREVHVEGVTCREVLDELAAKAAVRNSSFTARAKRRDSR